MVLPAGHKDALCALVSSSLDDLQRVLILLHGAPGTGKKATTCEKYIPDVRNGLALTTQWLSLDPARELFSQYRQVGSDPRQKFPIHACIGDLPDTSAKDLADASTLR